MLYYSRTDWLEMKRMYRDLQKEHMKRFKSEMGSRSVEEDGGPAKNQRGFVANCLLKVTCSSERGADVTELEVIIISCINFAVYSMNWR